MERTQSYQFDESTYETLCDHAKNGELVQIEEIINQEDKSSFGRLTFCPESPRRSPLVLAAQQGHLNVVQYFLDGFGDIIDINYGMSIGGQSMKTEHDATALFAAIVGNHIEVVKYLVSHGANVNKPSLRGFTPLLVASRRGKVEIMKFLIDNGVDINQLDRFGRNAFYKAAVNSQLEALEFLLKYGVNSAQVDIIGHTAMHIAAEKGRNRAVEALLEFGISPMFAVANPRDKDYNSCPLFLAAANGHVNTVSLFTSRDDCPEACKSDAMLLLAMHSISRRRIPSLDVLKKELENGLKIREENEVSVTYPEPNKVFGYRQEIKNREELRALWETPEFISTGLYYQRLLVEERCIGNNKGMAIVLKAYSEIATIFLFAKKYSDADALMVHTFESSVVRCEYLLPILQKGVFEDMMTFLIKTLDWVVKWAVKFVDNGYFPQFDRYLDLLARILDLISAINAVECYVKISKWRFVTCGLRLFSLWLSSIESETDKSRKNQRKTACQALGEKFVANHLYNDQTTLLHLELVRGDLAITNLGYLSPHKQGAFDILLIDNLLKWGADAAINTMDIYGRRPIHFVGDPFTDIVEDCLLFQLFVSYGAHPDAINSFDGSAYDDLNSDGDCQVPLSLACYAARRIVFEKIPYLTLDLPSSVKSFVQLHDTEHIPPMLEKSSYFKEVVYTT